MPERIAIAVSGAIAASLAALLGIWAKMKFVPRSAVFDNNGRPIYIHRSDCIAFRDRCDHEMSKKMESLRQGQIEARNEIRSLHRIVGDVKTSLARIEQWAKDKNNS